MRGHHLSNLDGVPAVGMASHSFQDGPRLLRRQNGDQLSLVDQSLHGIRDLALAHGIQCYVMATGGSVMADTEAAHLAQSIPTEMRLGTWSCQEMLARDVAPGAGVRNVDGELTVPETPGLGVAPDLKELGDPVAVYS